MKFTIAITRIPGTTFAQGITTVENGHPRYDKILYQHEAYNETLRQLGLQTILLDPLEDYPDAYFVEDVAIITRNKAIITRPGASSRRGEIDFIVPKLRPYRDPVWIEAPGTLDGGDVLMIENQCFIGISQRTNEVGAQQLGRLLEDEGINWTLINVKNGLHLKSDVNYIGRSTLLLTHKMAGLKEFKPFKKIIVDEDESFAANSLFINDHVLIPKGFPKTHTKLINEGFKLIQLDVSEVQKMDGGLTCLSLRF